MRHQIFILIRVQEVGLLKRNYPYKKRFNFNIKEVGMDCGHSKRFNFNIKEVGMKRREVSKQKQ